MRIKLLIGLILFCVQVMATEQKIKFSLNPSFQSEIQYRSAEVWNMDAFDLSPYLNWNDFYWFGNRAFYQMGESDEHTRLGVFVPQIKGPLYSSSNEVDALAVERETAFEFLVSHKHPITSTTYFELELHYEVLLGNGIYAYQTLGWWPFRFMNIEAKVGEGQQKGNEYAYGQGAVAGFSDYSLNTNMYFPVLPWKGLLNINLYYGQILQLENQQASYVSDKTMKKVDVVFLWVL